MTLIALRLRVAMGSNNINPRANVVPFVLTSATATQTAQTVKRVTRTDCAPRIALSVVRAPMGLRQVHIPMTAVHAYPSAERARHMSAKKTQHVRLVDVLYKTS